MADVLAGIRQKLQQYPSQGVRSADSPTPESSI